MLAKLNVLFSFIVQDINNKLSVLSQHLNSAQGFHYRTIESMLDYEIGKKILTCDNRNSGGRNLLPLHRALKFVVELIEIVKNSKDDDKMSTMASTAYDSTLAEYHMWPIRQAVYAAFLTLPSRKRVMFYFIIFNFMRDTYGKYSVCFSFSPS